MSTLSRSNRTRFCHHDFPDSSTTFWAVRPSNERMSTTLSEGTWCYDVAGHAASSRLSNFAVYLNDRNASWPQQKHSFIVAPYSGKKKKACSLLCFDEVSAYLNVTQFLQISAKLLLHARKNRFYMSIEQLRKKTSTIGREDIYYDKGRIQASNNRERNAIPSSTSSYALPPRGRAAGILDAMHGPVLGLALTSPAKLPSTDSPAGDARAI